MQHEADIIQHSPAWIYQMTLVPSIFEKWAPVVADAAGIQSGQHVLDVACGTGVLAGEALQRVGSLGSVTGLDLNPDMLAVASSLAADIHWQNGNSENLPFPDRVFDAVVSQFGLMFFGDRVKAISEMLRTVKPDGKIAVAVHGLLNDIPVYRSLAQIFKTYIGETAAELMNEPFCLGDPDQLRDIFIDAGANNLNILKTTVLARFPDLDALIDAELKGWMPMYNIMVSTSQDEQIREAAQKALHHFIDDNGAVVFEIPALIATNHQ